MIKKKVLLGILFVLFGASLDLYASEIYGQASLKGLRGIEVFVHCAGDIEIKKMETEIKNILKEKLEYARISALGYNAPNNINGKISNESGALKFLLTGFKKGGEYFIYASLQLHQRAYLAASHEYMDCPTWDRWKTGVFKEKEIFLEVEDMAREFTNDFISANGF
ncbi:MAG: hypothetical protein LBH25_05700 [Fibromonadaceae bacterium]|jgi:hypothetical protein|nr:hypothetical protein [Fibromonadaceae bacterium]